MIKVSRFRSCVKTPPKEDGQYFVVRLVRGELKYGQHLSYTKQWGWNTDMWGHEHAIVFKDPKYMWATITDEPVRRKKK